MCSFEYYLIQTFSHDNPDKSSILPKLSEKEKLTTFLSTLTTTFFALTTKCLNAVGRTQILYIKKKNSFMIDKFGEFFWYIPKGKVSIAFSDYSFNLAHLELGITGAASADYIVYQTLGSVSGTFTEKKIFRTKELSARNYIYITASNTLILLVKIYKEPFVGFMKTNTEVNNQPRILFKLEQPRVSSYTLNCKSKTPTSFSYRITKGIDDYISLPPTETSTLVSYELSLIFNNPLNQYRSDLLEEHFYYLVLSVPSSIQEYSISFTKMKSMRLWNLKC